MGSGESTTRKVSFGVDDEDRVRILRGIKLSEDVLQRMRGVANIAPGSSSSSSQKDTGTSSHASCGSPPQQSCNFGKPTTDTKKEQRRPERQQTTSEGDLAQVAQKEKAAASEEMTKGMSRERQLIREEAKKAQRLAQQLQKKDSQLKALDAFYKEQLAQMEKRNWEKYQQGKEQFHQAASKTEENVRSRNTDPACPGLQAQIFSCYSDNKDHTLKCSGLAKEYMQCINAAKKNLLINHG
ncbi:MICOS complex subunit mic25a isoform X2 [Gouania willdenowi]|uniref:CHCH domain-containing protein n=1 Tax=Gouania willdenowi TaxID=441366 RepID=A0A8C5H1T4_GOUWI|nr:MICOS complex subunit MIC25 isoform X2 [Gouania willdenowi]